jgi:glutaredoxin
LIDVSDDEWAVFGHDACVYCKMTIKLLQENGYQFWYYDVRKNGDALAFVKERGFQTVPQIYHNGEHIGGHSDLIEFLAGV